MRTADRALPTIVGPRPEDEPWPVQLFIGVERQPVPMYTYGDYTALYDDPEGRFTYDDPGTQPFPRERYDLFCTFHGLTITSGTPDADGRFTSSHVEMTLDNRDGQLSQYDAEGRLVDYLPGAKLDIWAVIEGQPWWLFGGEITAWRERQDNTIEAEAFDAFSELQQIVPEWKPGAHNDTVAQRLTKICTFAGFLGAKRFDTGNVALTSLLTTATALEEMQHAALSDGGFLFCDADGTLLYRNRSWVFGRLDQTEIPILSDNFCDAPSHVWDAEMTTDDEVIVNIATLTNTANRTVTASNAASVARYGQRTITRTGDQWVATGDGQDLADYLVIRRGDHYMRVERFVLHLHDPLQDLWRVGIDRRLGDTVTWMHEAETTTGTNIVILNVAVQQIIHEITPETWTTTLATTRVIGSTLPERYDRTAFHYDEVDPRNIYVY